MQVRDPGRYEILNEHGRGGLGRILRARDRDLGRDVAIKELISRGDIREIRFLREALITARLEHPGIVTVHEAGRWPDGTPFYAMRLVAGRPLRDVLAERTTIDDRLGLLHHVVAVAGAMAYAHGRGIIHRDLKPGNVIVGEFGETVVVDWGLAKDLSSGEDVPVGESVLRASDDGSLTAAGTVLGTPAYMPPEQERGEDVDQRADVYAIGMMLRELCTLGDEPPRDRRVRRGRIDEDLLAIIDKAIDPDPRGRYRDAGALVADLRAFRSGARISARRYSVAARLTRWIRRHRLLTVAAVAFLALGTVAYRSVLQARLAQQLAALGETQAEVEAGRQALLHGESAQAQRHLARAYQRGERSPGVVFMLSRALQPRLAEKARLTNPSGRMLWAEFSPDGSRIATTDDLGAQIWDARSHQLLHRLPHGPRVLGAAYSADGAWLVTAAGSVKIWDASTGALVREVHSPGGPRRYHAVVLSPDGRQVVALDPVAGQTDAWDTASGALLAALANDGSEFSSLAFSSDGRWLATGGGDDVRVFETATWTHALTIPGPQIRALSFDPTGPRLVTGSAGGRAAIWAVPSGERLHLLRELGEPIDAVAFAPTGTLVVTAARDGAVQVWNAATGSLQSQGNHLRTKLRSIEFDRRAALVVAAGASGKVVVQDAALGTEVAALEGSTSAVMSAQFDPSSRQVVAASLDGSARVWDAGSPYVRWRSPPVGDYCGIVGGLEPDQRFLAVGCWDRPTKIWDTARDQLLAVLPAVTRIEGDTMTVLPALSAAGDRAAIPRGHTVVIYALPGGRELRTIHHGAEVRAVGFAATGDVVSGAIDGSVLVTRDGRAPSALPRLSDVVDAVGFLASGRVVAAAGHRIRIYDPDRAAVVAELETSTRIGVLRGSPDGGRLITVAWPSAVEPAVLWDVERGQQIAKLAGHVGLVWSAQFLRDGREIVTTGVDGTVRRWDGATGRPLHVYRGSLRFVADATLSPDGAMVVAAGGDGLLRFWDAASERPLWTVPAHTPHVVGVHFEGADLVSRGFRGDVARWSLTTPANLDEAVASILRDASP